MQARVVHSGLENNGMCRTIPACLQIYKTRELVQTFISLAAHLNSNRDAEKFDEEFR
jgi:hypothetical protein